MYVVSMIGMSREIYFVYLIAFINKHLKCLFLLFGGKDLVLYAHPYNIFSDYFGVIINTVLKNSSVS